jgi:hypothetical protein
MAGSTMGRGSGISIIGGAEQGTSVSISGCGSIVHNSLPESIVLGDGGERFYIRLQLLFCCA